MHNVAIVGDVTEHRRAAIYARISSDPKKDTLGVRRQERACRALAARHRWPVVAVFVDDDKSAFHGKRRPGYEAMVEAVKAGEVTAIVAWAPARLTRHPRELEDLIDLLDAHRVEVATHIAGDYDLSTSGGRLTARVVGSVARHESEEKSERVRLKMTEIAQAGRFHGGQRPFGYERDGVTVVPEEAEAVRLMARRIAEGVGLRRLQAELNAAGVPTVNGGPWRFSAVRQILTNPRIAGLSHHRGEIVADHADWPAILDRDSFEQLQATLLDPRRKQQRPARYLLTGLVVTPDGAKMIGKRGNGNRRLYAAAGVSVDAEHLEAYIVKTVLRLTDGAALPKAKAPRVSSRVAALEKELEQLAALRGKGRISLREWMAAKAPLDKRLTEARKTVPAERVPAGVSAVLGRKGGLRRAWPGMTVDEQRRAVAAVLEKVVVQPVGPRGRVFDTDRIEPIRRR
jgi:site-specific DNA recombinase